MYYYINNSRMHDAIQLGNFFFFFFKLHFITLNCTSFYTLHSKLFECMFCTINYDSYYILHHAVKLNENSKLRMQNIIRVHLKTFLNAPRCNFYFVFKALRRGPIRSFSRVVIFFHLS